MLIRRLARPMLATMFIAGGVDTLRNPGKRPEVAAPLIAKGEQILPDQITDNLPTDPDTVVKINAAVQVGGGLLLASGKAPRLASLVLAGSLVPTTYAGHAFWSETDPATKAAQRIQFLKNVSILGGLLIAAVDTEGKPSLGWRSRRAAKRANQALTVALPFAASRASSTSDTLNGVAVKAGDTASKAAERGHDLAHRIATSDTTKQLSASGTELAHTARGRAAHLAALAADRGSELAQAAAERGPVLAAHARQRGNELAQVAADRGSELAQVAAERGPVLAAQARERGSELAALAGDRGNELAETARTRGAELAKDGAKKRRKAVRRWGR